MRKRRWFLVSLAVIGTALSLAFGLGRLRPSQGNLYVTSVPPGASIFLDQQFAGVTPKLLEGLARGTHLLRLGQAGYAEVSRTIEIKRRRSEEDFELEPLPATGALIIHSEPTGAHTWIDGERGALTPARTDFVVAGPHEVKVGKAGWITRAETVQVAAGGEVSLNIKLTSAKVAYYLDAIEREPDNSTHYVELGRIYVRNGEVSRAFDLLMTVIDSYGRQGRAMNSIVSSGCIISGAYVDQSILSPNVHVHSGADVRECVVMNDVDIGRGARLRRAIIDKRVRIPDGTVIGYDAEHDKARFTVSDGGIVVVPKDAALAGP